MPAALVAFFALQGLVAGFTAKSEVGAALRPHHVAGEFREGWTAWTSPRWDAVAGPDRTCRVMLFVTFQGRRPKRVQIDQYEQTLDMGHSRSYIVQSGERLVVPVVVLEPIGGAVVGYRNVVFTCYAAHNPLRIGG